MRRIATGAFVALALLATACGDDDDDASSDGTGGSGERQEYVDALKEAQATGDLDDEANQCLAETYVDVIGLDRLKDAVTPDEIRESPDSNPTDLGIELDEADGEAFYDTLGECTDAREFFMTSFTEGEEPAVAECLEQEIDDDMLKQFVVAVFTESAEESAASPALAEIQAVYAQCSSQGTGTSQP